MPPSKNYQNKADSYQQKAIEFGTGPALITAGPGSGKTFVLTHHILYLIHSLGVSPGQILVLTYSKAAAQEMKSRFLNLSGQSVTDVTFGTFHSVFCRILLQYSHSHNYRIIEEKQETELMQTVLKMHRFKLTTKEYASVLLEILHALKGKEKLDSFLREKEDPEKDFHGRIFKSYESLKEEMNYVDYDDILMKTRDLFASDHRVLGAVQSKFRFVLVDEFQDINPVQYEVVSMICDKERNIYAVGDDDQSIYAFRGATPENVGIFLSDYPDAECLPLFNNYRCGKRIVKVAGKVIRHNKTRIPKKITSKTGKTGRVKMRFFADRNKQFEFMAKEIKRLMKSGSVDIAILVRINRIPREMTDALDKYRIPYCIAREEKEKGFSVDLKKYPVKILTMHASKGLEFETVFLPDLYRSNVPIRQGIKEGKTEEERRLFYVAMTRAKENLYLFCPLSCGRYKNKISGFLIEAGF